MSKRARTEKIKVVYAKAKAMAKESDPCVYLFKNKEGKQSALCFDAYSIEKGQDLHLELCDIACMETFEDVVDIFAYFAGKHATPIVWGTQTRESLKAGILASVWNVQEVEKVLNTFSTLGRWSHLKLEELHDLKCRFTYIDEAETDAGM